jgi:chromosome segregation ATPase
LKDVLAALNQLSEQVTAQQETIAALQNGAENNEAEDISIEEIMDLTDEDISALLQAGEISEEDAAGIKAYQAEVVAAIEAEQSEGQGEDEPAEGELAGVGAGSDSSSTGSSAELSALQNQVRELSARFEREDAASENAEIEHYFATIEGNLTTLAQEKAALTELSEKLQAENEALRHAVKTGTRPLAFSAEGRATTGNNGELHEFESRVKTHTESGKTHAQAVMLAHKENPEAHQDWIRQQSK